MPRPVDDMDGDPAGLQFADGGMPGTGAPGGDVIGVGDAAGLQLGEGGVPVGVGCAKGVGD